MGIRFLCLQLAIRGIKWLYSDAWSPQKEELLFGGEEKMKVTVEYHPSNCEAELGPSS